MREFREDNNGYVSFPQNRTIQKKVLIYLVAIDDEDYLLSNINLGIKSEYLIDDVMGTFVKTIKTNLSVPLVSSICIGWCNTITMSDDEYWFATFRDLSNEGKKLYYSIKKLHNNKDIRILTFVGVN